jgi:hypothetical protein
MSAQPPNAVNALLANVCDVVRSVVTSPPESTHPRAEVFYFLSREARLPRIGDERAPWTYCGWMLPYVISLHAHPLFGKCHNKLNDKFPATLTSTRLSERGIGHCPDRWGYHLRTLAAGELLDEPIPRIEFCGEFENSVRRIWEGERAGIAGWCHVLDQTDGYSWDSFKHLVDWLAFALGVETEPPRIGINANEALYRTVNIEPLLLQPCDYFGAALAARKGTGGKAWNPTAFFPTPHHLVELMTQLTMSHDDDLRSKKVSDPALGSGRMLLHASNYSLRLYGQDIDPLVVKISKINGALYAPWMSFPFPASFFANDVPQLNHITLEADVQVYPLNAGTQGTLF